MTQFPLQRPTPSPTLRSVPRPDADAAAVSSRAQSDAWALRFVRNLAPQDWYIAAYFGVMMLAVVFGSGPDRDHCERLVAADIGCLFAGLALTRGGLLKAGTLANAMVYRLTVWLTVFLSYFQLRNILPAVSERALDADIFAFDTRVLHVEPSLAWDRFVSGFTTEWFAFFYFGYFFLLSAHVLGVMLLSRDMHRLAHFAMGVFIVFCTGHLVYMLVPGYGPYQFLAGRFQHELHGGLFWSWVQATVHAGGAQKDIFPSLHTAAPTFFALYSFRHRDRAPYKYTWPVVAFCASQIICATMFLRWHYLVDIFAGITLACIATYGGEALVKLDDRRRAMWRSELGPDAVQPNFIPLDWAGLKKRRARSAA